MRPTDLTTIPPLRIGAGDLTGIAAATTAQAMLALISPAKTLDYKRPFPDLPATDARFRDKAETLAGAAARLSQNKLSELMHISPALAKLNVERFRNFAGASERPAIFAFAGDVYAGFEVHSLDEEAIVFAQDHLRILSGLYGVLRPLDRIKPYRLEMGTRWAPRRRDLYAYWGRAIAEQVEQDLEAAESRTVINLASKEYWQAVGSRLDPSVRVIEVDFREPGPDGPRFNTFAGKRARGMMARFICEHRLDRPEQLKQFDSDGYSFDPKGSDDQRWRFMRAPY